MIKSRIIWLTLALFGYGCASQSSEDTEETAERAAEAGLRVEHDTQSETIEIFRADGKTPIVTQNAKADFRPYLHPIVAPDGKGVLTEYSPGHHKHQTGLYWGFTRVNGRDYFHNPQGDYWRRVSATVLEEQGDTVKWQTVYDLLDEEGNAVLTETQSWWMREHDGKFLLNLEWSAEAKTAVTIGKYDYGGLFLRMPWKEGIEGEVVNAARQRNEKAEGQAAMWVDVGMQVEGREDLAHIALFDHPDNRGFPQKWRVDSQLGIGPAPTRDEDWTISKGETHQLRHQVLVYTGELNNLEVTTEWENFSGDHSTYSTAHLWRIAQEEGRKAKFLSPEAAVDSMTLIEGYKVNAWAAEPMITQPMAFCWDDRGRLWVAENRDYESRGHGFSRAGNSRILILEDTNGDGRADSRKVFMEGIAFPAAIAVGFDGLFVGAPPNLLFVPDKDGDDKAEMEEIEVRLTGWGIRDRHETLNSLHWGPDGWLYGLQGFATPSKVRKPEGKGRLYRHNDPFPEDILEGEGVDINGGVWRYHPTKDRFEVVSHGFSNPWGIDHDAKGQLLISACVIPHLWHVIPGGIYHRQGGQHFNPYVYSDIKTIADHRHRSAHGGARVYLSDAFPREQHGRIFMANIHEHAVLSDVLVKKGSGFTSHHGQDFLLANNAQWVGFSMELGPDGSLYVLDWHDADICGQEVLNGETGRIFRISPEKSQAEDFEGRYSDLSGMTDQELVGLQTSKSAWHARRARLILQNRALKGQLKDGTHEQLRRIFQSHSNADWRLRGMWGLHVTGGFTSAQLIKALEDKDEYIRAWAIQLLCEDQSPSPAALAKFRQMARKDESAVVRLYLASALQRIDEEEQRWQIAGELMKHGEDADDHNLPKMIWFGMEPLVGKDPSRALGLAVYSRIPMLSQFIARRTVDGGALETLIAAIGTAPASQLDLMEGMRDGLEGRSDLRAPANWKPVYAKLKQSDAKVKQIALELAQKFGDTEAAMQYLATLKDQNASLGQRQKAMHILASQQRQELAKELPNFLDHPELRIDAIRAVASYDHKELGEMLIGRYPDLNIAEKSEMIQTMSSRPTYGGQLTSAMKNGLIPKKEVPTYAARQLLRVVGSGFVEVYGPIEESSTDEKNYDKYRELLTDQALSKASAPKGRVLFQNTCAPCHKMYGEGANIGPDITGSNRANLDYLLFQILDPSGEIQDDYKMVVVTTRDGRTYSGNVVAENDRQLTLRVIGKDAVVINQSEILSKEETPVSMMPPGLLNSLSDEQVLDLVAYLQTVEQVPLP